MTDGFLSRWSRRKLDVKKGWAPEEPEPSVRVQQPMREVPLPVSDSAAGYAHHLQPEKTPMAPNTAPDAPPLPTLADVEDLTPTSDFKPFMARGVADEVKNAAMKKLFADPHFNVMDRLDTYIDDYSLSDPIPESMLKRMASAKFLNLFDDDETEAEPAVHPLPAVRDDANSLPAEVMSQSQPPAPPSPPAVDAPPYAPIAHDHTDMRLQPDHATAAKAAGRGSE